MTVRELIGELIKKSNLDDRVVIHVNLQDNYKNVDIDYVRWDECIGFNRMVIRPGDDVNNE